MMPRTNALLRAGLGKIHMLRRHQGASPAVNMQHVLQARAS